MFLTVAAALLLFQNESKFSFYPDTAYDQAVPKPESILGYGPGEKLTTYRDQEQVVLAITSAAPDRTKVWQYGKSTEGRPLRVVAISSPKNIARLAEIQKEHERIARGESVDTVPIVWINQTIHGNEPASFETAMWTLYNLAASRGTIAKQLEQAVVILNPVYNPDGHERFVVSYNSVSNGSSSPLAFEKAEIRSLWGRFNHYRFDMNRDRISFTQDESRQEYAEVLRWSPQVYIDQHGQVSSYFMPPEPMSINPNVDRARNTKWTEIYGQSTAKSFDRFGLRYFVKEDYDFYFPGFLDISASLSGAIGMTHETEGFKYLAQDLADGTTWTMKRAVFKHFLSALAVVEATSVRAKEAVTDYVAFKHSIVSGKHGGDLQSVVVTCDDPRPLARLQKQLGFAGVVSTLTSDKIDLKGTKPYWPGVENGRKYSLVVNMTQPQGAMAKALLEPETPFEPEFIKRQLDRKNSAPKGETWPGPQDGEFYDTTGWSLPYAHNLVAFASKRDLQVRPARIDTQTFLARSEVGYALSYRDDEDALFTFEALNLGLKAMATTDPMVIDGRTFEPGTVLFLGERNRDGYREQLVDLLAKYPGAELHPIRSAYPDRNEFSPGSESVMMLRKPKIGVVFGSISDLPQSVSGIWWLMEREWKLPFVPLSSAGANGNLSEFTAIVVPSGVSVTDKLKAWAREGGVLIVLDSLGGLQEMKEVEKRPTYLPGLLSEATIDRRSFLSFGFSATAPGVTEFKTNEPGQVRVAAPVQGSTFYPKRKEGGTVATVTGKVLSGWVWPDDTIPAITGTAFIQVTPMGGGYGVAFLQDPTSRVMWPGWHKALLNSMLFGAGSY